MHICYVYNHTIILVSFHRLGQTLFFLYNPLKNSHKILSDLQASTSNINIIYIEKQQWRRKQHSHLLQLRIFNFSFRNASSLRYRKNWIKMKKASTSFWLIRTIIGFMFQRCASEARRRFDSSLSSRVDLPLTMLYL